MIASPSLVAEFARAVVEERLLRVEYRTARGTATEREVAVLGLAFRGGGWLAACHCRSRGAHRAFRLERVVAAEDAGPAPEWGRGFDRRAFASAALNLPLPARAIRVAIRLAEPLAPFAAAVVPGLAEVGPDGACIAHLRTSRPEAAVALALSLGPSAELVHPPELARLARRLRGRVVAAATPPHRG